MSETHLQRAICIGFAACGAFALFYLLRTGDPLLVGATPQPGLFPALAAAAAAIFGIAAAWPPRDSGNHSDDAPKTLSMASEWIGLAAIALALGYVLLLPMLGYVVSSMVAFVLFSLIFGRLSPLVLLALSLAVPVIIHLFFETTMSRQLPAGLIW